MTNPRSVFVRVRGLRLHLRVFGPDDAPPLFLLHGWLDNSASFAPLAECLRERAGGNLRVIVPDHRGFGYSAWAPQGYWFPDYVADFDAIVAHFAPTAPFLLVGHSLGAQVASLYAGLRPQRVHRLALMDGLAVPDMPAHTAPARYGRWLTQLHTPPSHHSYPDFETLAARIRAHQPRLNVAQADFLARCWAAPGADGQLHLLADPAHRMNGPTLYRSAESEAIWHAVTAPTLHLLADESPFREQLGAHECERRHACFAQFEDVTLDGVGHLMHVEAAERCADILTDFMLKPRAPCA